MSTTPVERPVYASNFVLPNQLDAWMDDVARHYTEVGVPLPAHRYWTIGTPAHDCEQVVLAVQQMFLGTATAPTELVACNGPRGLTFTLEIIRCTPTMDRRGQAPTGDAIEDSSVDPVIDMECLLDIAKYFDEWNKGVVVTVDAVPANGGFHGAFATYTVSL